MQLVIPGQPIPKSRMTQAGKWNPRARATLEYQKFVAYNTLQWMHQNVEEAGRIYSAPELTVKRLYFYRKGNLHCDIDNLIKTILDGLQYANLIVNDHRITRLQDVCVIYGCEKPYAEIELVVPDEGVES